MYLMLCDNQEDDELRLKEASCRADLVLPSASFLVAEDGITVVLRPPLSRLSGHYRWPTIPIGIAALKLMIVGSSTDVFCRMMRMLSPAELDHIEKGIGFLEVEEEGGVEVWTFDEDAPLAAGVDLALSWTKDLADRCPLSWAAHDLRRMATMSGDDLDSYVGGFLS